MYTQELDDSKLNESTGDDLVYSEDEEDEEEEGGSGEEEEGSEGESSDGEDLTVVASGSRDKNSREGSSLSLRAQMVRREVRCGEDGSHCGTL